MSKLTYMPYTATYPQAEPARAEVDGWPGLVLMEFGAPWCPICQAAQAGIEKALQARPEIRHVKIEDGKGRPLGRSFAVKLWPNLVLLNNGQVVAQWVRPDPEQIEPLLIHSCTAD